MDTELEQLLEADITNEQFMRRLLARLEALTRRIALVGVAEWTRLEVVDEDLFYVVLRLGRPAWGSWIQMISGLLKVARRNLSSGSPEVRKLIEESVLLREFSDLWNREFPQETKDLLKAFAPFTSEQKHGQRITFAAIIQRFGEVRNRIVHDSVMQEDYWTGLAEASRPLVIELCSVEPQSWMESNLDACAPWLYRKGGGVFEYNGLNKKLNASYIDQKGNRETSEERGVGIVSAFELLLGRSASKEHNLRKLLAELSPEENRGVFLGDFLVQKPAGEGGFAIVYDGRQLSTGLRVAIKILRDGLDEDTVERFKREARYQARIQHPNVVHVVTSGDGHWTISPEIEPSGDWYQKAFMSSAKHKNYMVMEWIQGETLEEIFRKQFREEYRVMAGWFEQAAMAISVIHSQGLIHRDIKPGNIMVTSGGSIKLMDFGVAKAVKEGETKYTVAGTTVGTPAYMSPEQVRTMEIEAEVGPPSDVYSLCATFYELFTGQRLFGHDKFPEATVTNAKRDGQRPVAARVYAKDLSPELNSILQSGLEPEVNDRYQSAEALLTDIRHYLKDEPIEHELPTLWRRTQLAYRRNRRVANITGAFVAIAIFGSAVYLHLIQAERDHTRERYADLLFEQARQELLAQRPLQASVYLAEVLKQGRDTTPVRVLLGEAMPAIDAQQGSIGSASDPLMRPVLSPDGHILSTTRLDKKISLWSVSEKRLLRIVEATQSCEDSSGTPSVEFSAQGNFLLVWCGSEARLFSGDGAKIYCDLTGHNLDITAGVFSADERWVATASVDDTARLWSSPGCRFETAFSGHQATVNSVSFSGNGETLVTASSDGTARLWRVPSGEMVRTFHNSAGGPVSQARLSASGDELVGSGAELDLWQVSTGNLRLSMPISYGTTSVFGISDTSSTALVQKTPESAPTLYDLDTGQEIVSLEEGFIAAAAFNTQGTYLATGGQDQRIRVYDTRSGIEIASFSGHTGAFPILDVVLNQTGEYIASSDGAGTVKLWKLQDRQESAIAGMDHEQILFIDRVADTNEIWAVNRNGRVSICCGAGGKSSSVVLESGPVVAAEMHPDGTLLALLSVDGELSLWRTADAGLMWRVSLTTHAMTARPIKVLHFSEAGDAVVVVGKDGSLEGFRVPGGDKLGMLPAPSATFVLHDIYCSKGLSDCRAIGEGMGENGIVEFLYDYSERHVVRRYEGHQGPFITTATFSRDGTRFVTAGGDRTARLFFTTTGTQETSFLGHGGFVTSADINAENTLVVTVSADNVIRLWDAKNGALLRILSAGGDESSELRFDRTGRNVLVSGVSGLKSLPLPYESRSSKELIRLVAAIVPWRINAGHLDEFVPTGSKSDP